MHRSRQLMDQLHRAKLEVAEHEQKVIDLYAQIAKIHQELDKFPPLSDQVAVDITERDVIFLSAGSEFGITRDELQVLIEMLGGEQKPAAEKATAQKPDLLAFNNTEAVDAFVEEARQAGMERISKGSGLAYYRVRSTDPRKTIFSSSRIWKLRQFLRRKAQNKNSQKLLVEVLASGKGQILWNKTAVFGMNA